MHSAAASLQLTTAADLHQLSDGTPHDMRHGNKAIRAGQAEGCRIARGR